MEIADGIVINKADGDNVEKANLAASHYRNALHLFPMPESGILPQVRCYSGFYGLGIDEVLKMIFDYIDKVRSNGYFQYRRNEQSKYWMYESINEHLRNNFYYNTIVQSMLSEMSNKVLCGQITSFVAAKKLLDAYYSELKVNN